MSQPNPLDPNGALCQLLLLQQKFDETAEHLAELPACALPMDAHQLIASHVPLMIALTALGLGVHNPRYLLDCWATVWTNKEDPEEFLQVAVRNIKEWDAQTLHNSYRN
ncbi:MAG: hypothetical protein JWR19_2192 [Pedosphaera sp.]|nr:hypothetical protein [Pedosphaera sp.]